MKPIGSTTCPFWQGRLGGARNSIQQSMTVSTRRPHCTNRSSVKATDFGGIFGLRSVPKAKVDIASGQEWRVRKISQIFKRDVSLSYRLLRYLNSPIFSFQAEIRSIPHALTLPGEQAMRKWISRVSVAALGAKLPDCYGCRCYAPCLRIDRQEKPDVSPGERVVPSRIAFGDGCPTECANVRCFGPDSSRRCHQNGLVRQSPSRYRPIFEVVLD